MCGLFNDGNGQDGKQYDHVPISHEILAAAAAWEAMKGYEDHQRDCNHAPIEHETALKLLAALCGAAVDRYFEQRHLEKLDIEKAKERAKEVAEHLYTSHMRVNGYPGMQQQQPPPPAAGYSYTTVPVVATAPALVAVPPAQTPYPYTGQTQPRY